MCAEELKAYGYATMRYGWLELNFCSSAGTPLQDTTCSCPAGPVRQAGVYALLMARGGTR